MKDLLNLEDNRLNVKYFIVLMFIAFIFSIAVRMIWVYQFSDVESFKWNNELMINTNDGYYYAEGARDILSGDTQINSTSPVHSPLSKLTAMLASILPISFETLILYMPTIISSFLVVPIMLISRLFSLDKVGFVAALLGSITWSYYNRTMTGYYDTDMLVIIFPSFFIWGVILGLSKEDSFYFIVAPIFALFAMSWHGGMIHVINGTFFLTLIYTLLYERHNRHYYQFLSALVISLTTLSVFIKFIMIILLVGVFHYLKDRLTDKIVIIITILSAVVYLYFGGMSWIIGILNNAYVTRALHSAEIDLNLHYYGVINTIKEAGHIPFEIFANRISGHTITFMLSIVGYFLLVVKHRLFILTLPMLVLGFFALQGGLRFTVFSIPFMAIGVSYIIFITANIFKNLFSNRAQVYVKYAFITISSISVLYPNVVHIVSYRVPTVFNKNEVKILDKLSKIASKEDYVVSWWDYGYPIRYYADVKTLIDGAQHNGGSNYPVSFSLLNNQLAGANMARLSVEYNEVNLKTTCGTAIECILKNSNIQNPNKLLTALTAKGLKLPPKTRDIYFYLPNRMMNIIPTVDLFSNLDLLSGKQHPRPLFYQTQKFKEDKTSINLGAGIKIMKKSGEAVIGNQTTQVNQFVVVEYDNKGKLRKNIQTVNPSSDVFVIFMKSYNKFIVLNKRLFNSLYVQLFILENYDKDLFEPVLGNPYAKIYKLKI